MGEESSDEVTSLEGPIIIPRWFAAFVAFILAGAVPWCVKINTDMATIAAKLDAAFIQQAKDVDYIKDRVNRLETNLNEHEKNTRRTVESMQEKLHTLEGGRK